MKISCVLVLFSCLLLNEVWSFANFQEKTIHWATSNFGDISLGTVNPRITFDKDLFVGEDFFCSSNFVASIPECIPCNYSGPSGVDGKCLDLELNTRDVPGLTEEQKNTLPNCPCEPTLCDGELILIGEKPKEVVVTKSEARKIFKFENIHWDRGFVVHVQPASEGQSDYFISSSSLLEASKMYAYSFFTDPIYNLMACPSFPRFGASTETITNFLVIEPSVDTPIVSYSISIEYLPFLDEKGERNTPTIHENATSFSNPLPTGDSPTLFRGDFLQNADGDFPSYYRSVLVFGPIEEECTSFSIHAEILKLDLDTNYFGVLSLSFDLVSESTLNYLMERTSNARPFKDEQVVLQAYRHSVMFPMGSAGSVVSVCPSLKADHSGYEKTYININLNGGRSFVDYEVLLFVRPVATSPFFSKKKIGEMIPIHFQNILQDSIIMSCPCLEADNCSDPIFDIEAEGSEGYRFFNRISRMNVKNYLGLKNEFVHGSDLSSKIGVPFQKIEDFHVFLFRCHRVLRDSSCSVIRPIPILESQNPIIYPAPNIAKFENAILCDSRLDEVPRPPILNNSVGLLIFKSVGSVDFFSLERLNQCSISFPTPSRLMTEDLFPPTQEVINFASLENPQENCSAPKFSKVSQVLENLENELSEIVDDALVEATQEEDLPEIEGYSRTCGFQYGSFELLFSDEWQNCQNLANSFLNFEIIETEIKDTAECVEFVATDPCCNDSLSWDQCCVIEGRVSKKNTSIPVSTNDQEILTCNNADCMKTFVLDYQASWNRVNHEQLCDFAIELGETPDVYIRECKTKWIGDDLTGMHCEMNEDCVSLFGTGTCDLTNNRCVGIRKEMEFGFLECLLDRMNSITRSSFFTEITATSLELGHRNTSILTADFLREYLKHEECVSDYGPMSPLREHSKALSLLAPEEQLCPSCFDVWCLMGLGCDLPLQCLDEREICRPSLGRVSSNCQPPLSDDSLCNWDNELDEANCNTEEFQCMYCHNSFTCVLLPATTKEECESTPICVASNGSVHWNVDQEDCNAIQSCSEKCLGKECENQEQCETLSGTCSDNDLIVRSIQHSVDLFPLLGDALKGVCVRPLNGYNAPSCPYVNAFRSDHRFGLASGVLDTSIGNSYDFTTQRGCILFSNCSQAVLHFGVGTGGGVLPPSCELYANTTETCAEWNGQWLPLPIQNQEDCENPLHLDEEEFPGFCEERGLSYYSQKNRFECEACGGKPTSPADWKKGVWVTGFSDMALWKQNEMVRKYQVVDDTISFSKLNELFVRSIDAVDAFTEQAAIQCKISTFSPKLKLLSCDCAGNETECESPFNDKSRSIGLVWFCPGVDFQGLSGQVVVKGVDVSGVICKLSSVSLAPVEEFVGNWDQVPLTILGDPNVVDPFAVRNDVGASVGKVVGDGFSLNDLGSDVWEGDVLAMSVRFFGRKDLLDNSDPSHYFDLGIEITDSDEKFYPNQIEIRPLDAPLITPEKPVGSVVDDDVQITGQWLKPLSYKPTTRIYPIVRQIDWKDEGKHNILSEGEKVMVAFFAALYGLGFVISSIVLAYLLVYVPSLANITTFILFFMILATHLFRCVYFSLFAAGRFQTEDITSYALVEPPSFFLISVGSILLMSFAFCAYCLRTATPQQDAYFRYWSIWGVSNLFLYLILAVVLVVLSQVETRDTVIENCFGRVVETEQNFNVQTVRIAYHSFLLIVATFSVSLILYFNWQMEQNIQIRVMKILTMVSGVSIFLTNLLWVIYSSASGSSPYFVIPLWLCEGLPLTILPFLVFPPKE